MQVTVSYRAREEEQIRAKRIGGIPGFELKKREEVDWKETVVVVSRTGLFLKIERREYRWHPGLLHTRVSAGWEHPLVRAMALVPGDRVLDCTLGLGTDAAFLAAMTGVAVMALEIRPELALLTCEGLRGASHDVHVINADSRVFLKQLPDASFDIIQGDPMFPKGTGVTNSLDLIRHVGQYEPLGMEWLQEARRVARKRVVVRDIAKGTLLESMKPDDILDVGRKRPRYGIWFSSS